MLGAWDDLVIVPDESRGLLAFSADLGRLLWEYRPPYAEDLVMIVKLGSFPVWQGALVRAPVGGADRIVVQQYGSLLLLEPRTGGLALGKDLMAYARPEGLGIAASVINSCAMPYVDIPGREARMVVTIIEGSLDESLDTHGARDYVIGVSW